MEVKSITRIDKLADTLSKDMQRRSLRTGDLYLTAAEASQMLGVSPVMANRAMNVLAGRRLLVRHRRRGSFVGPAFQSNTRPPALRVIYIIKGLMRDEKYWCSIVGSCLQGLHAVLPGYQVQSNVLSRDNPLEMMQQILKQYTSEVSLCGMVLLSCPREVQELVQNLMRERRLPAVSFGTVYPNITEIPSVDQDQFESGRLQAKYLLDCGHRRITLLMRDNWQPGDNLMLDGVMQALADAGLGYGVLVTRSLPENVSLIKTEIISLLTNENRPTGFICRSKLFAETTCEAARSISLRVPGDVDIVFSAVDKTVSAASQFPSASAKYSSLDQLALVAEILEKMIAGKKITNKHIVLPVELVEPQKKG